MARRGKTRYRRGLSRRTRPMVVDAQAIRQLQVYRYPFSMATSCPKIPDGKVTQSFGIREQLAQPTANNNELLFILSPIFGNQIYIRYGGANSSYAITNWGEWSAAEFIYDVTYPPKPANANGPNNPWPEGVAADSFQMQMNNDAAKWRLVSKALKLKCVTSDDMNDGYWEAVRLPMSFNKRNFHLLFLTVTFPRTTATVPIDNSIKDHAMFSPTEMYSDLLWLKENWLLNPTYQSGRIKNLGQYEFRLQPQKNEHDFIDIPHLTDLSRAEYSTHGIELEDGKDRQHLFEWGYDTQFDTIAI